MRISRSEMSDQMGDDVPKEVTDHARINVDACNLSFLIGSAVDAAITNAAWPAAIARAKEQGTPVRMNIGDVEAATRALGLDWAIEPAKESLTRIRAGWKSREAERAAAPSTTSGRDNR
jgi:hypothetical protein